MIITIDGPAGSGKSSTAKAVAKKLGFRHLDSGAFYRVLTYAALDHGIERPKWASLSPDDLNALNVHAEPAEDGFKFFVSDGDVTEAIRSDEVDAHVSEMAAVPAVREWLMETLRSSTRDGNLVTDGRDMGTVVFPAAELKVFLIAQSEARAYRRLAETGNNSPTYVDVQNEVDRLGMRDRKDTQRGAAPLKQARDAVVIDTTFLSFDDQVDMIVRLAEERMEGASN